MSPLTPVHVSLVFKDSILRFPFINQPIDIPAGVEELIRVVRVSVGGTWYEPIRHHMSSLPRGSLMSDFNVDMPNKTYVHMFILLIYCKIDAIDLSYECRGMNTGEIQSLRRVNKLFKKIEIS